MTIAVGIVFHGRSSRPPVSSDGAVEVITRTNASLEDGATPWLGFAANHELLQRQADGADWYVALSPDIGGSADDLRRLVGSADAAGLDVAAPLLRTPWGLAGPQAAPPGPRRWLAETARGVMRQGFQSPRSAAVSRSAWVSGACMALRTSSPETRFDPAYFMYFEDAALCHRVARAGGRVGVCHDVVVSHRSGWSGDDPLRWRKGVEFSRSAIRFAAETGQSGTMMRAAGLVRYGSRRVLPRRSGSERVAAQVITRGFALAGRAPGLAELAAEFNAAHLA